MKKLALVAIATALIGIGHAPVSAQQPINPIPPERQVECGESTGRVDTNGDGIADSCVDFYVAPTTTQAVIPPPITTTTTTTTLPPVVPPAGLPETGSSISPILAMGAALLAGGAMVIVATRRRSPATTS